MLSRSSPETSKIFRPSSANNEYAAMFIGPRDLTAIGWKKCLLQGRIFINFTKSRQFHCRAGDGGIQGWSTVLRVSQGANNSHVPGDRLAFFPWDHGEAIRAFAVWSCQSMGLLGDWKAYRAKLKVWATRSFYAWCLAVLPGALLQTKLCVPFALSYQGSTLALMDYLLIFW